MFQPSFWWCRISQPSTVCNVFVRPRDPGCHCWCGAQDHRLRRQVFSAGIGGSICWTLRWLLVFIGEPSNKAFEQIGFAGCWIPGSEPLRLSSAGQSSPIGLEIHGDSPTVAKTGKIATGTSKIGSVFLKTCDSFVAFALHLPWFLWQNGSIIGGWDQHLATVDGSCEIR